MSLKSPVIGGEVSGFEGIKSILLVKGEEDMNMNL